MARDNRVGVGCRAGIGLWVLLCLAAGCVRTSYNLATQREEIAMTSTDKEIDLGRKLATQVEKELPLVLDETLQQRVRTIGSRLAAVCDRQELVYQFAVVKQDEINAFSLPGGYVFVNEGLVKKTKSDDELASVMAHELGHICARHAMKRYETTLGTQLLALASLAAARHAAGAAQGVGMALHAAQLAYARQDELEADRLAVKYVQAANYDPKAMLTFLQRLRALEKDHLQYLPRGLVRPQYAMTHPFIPDRIRAVKEALFGVADYMDYLNSPD